MIYRFDNFTLDTNRHQLIRGEKQIEVEPQIFSLLVFLLERSDRVVTKQEIIEGVWKRSYISDSALNSRVSSARLALGDNGRRQALIRTYRGRGFCLVVPVKKEKESRHNLKSIFDRQPRIAITDICNQSDIVANEKFCAGLTDEIICEIVQYCRYPVVRLNSRKAKNVETGNAVHFSNKLAFDYLLDGKLQQIGHRVRISFNLRKTADGTHIWSDRFDRTLVYIFDLQSSIAKFVVGAIDPQIRISEQEAAIAHDSAKHDAWQLYQSGLWHLWRRNTKHLAEARRKFIQAIRVQPEFALPFAGLAQIERFKLLFGSSPHNERSKVRALSWAKHACKLQPKDSWIRATLGAVHMVNREHQSAIRELKLALELNPHEHQAQSWLGSSLMWSGHASESLVPLNTIIEQSPNDPQVGPTMSRLAEAHLSLGDFELACDLAYKGRQIYDGGLNSQLTLISSLALAHHMNEAYKGLDDLLARRPDASISLVKDTMPFTAFRDQEIFLSGLRKAGLPDQQISRYRT